MFTDMKAYSLDLRERVIAALTETELSQAEIAEQFQLSLATVENWWRRWRESQSVAPRPHGGGTASTLHPHAHLIRATLQRQPDATLEELCAQVEATTGVRSSPSMMCRELQRLKLPRKKVFAR